MNIYIKDKGVIVEGCDKAMPDSTKQEYWTAISKHKPAVFNESVYNSDMASFNAHISYRPHIPVLNAPSEWQDGKDVTGLYEKWYKLKYSVNTTVLQLNEWPENVINGLEPVAIPIPSKEQGINHPISFSNNLNTFKVNFFDEDSEMLVKVTDKLVNQKASYLLTIDEATILRDFLTTQLQNQK